MQVTSGIIKTIFTLLVLTTPVLTVQAEMTERIVLNTGELILISQGALSDRNADLSLKTLNIPPICTTDICPESGSLSLSDGTLISLRSGYNVYNSSVKGLSIGVRINDANASSLLQGKGGMVDVSIRQGKAPYYTGEFNDEILSYRYNAATLSGSESKTILVNLLGSVKAGSCTISNGGQLNFSFYEEQHALISNLARNGKQFIQTRNVEFDCVNVSTITMKFDSGAYRQGLPGMLFDSSTGVNMSLEYLSGSESGVVSWDGAPIGFSVHNNRTVVELSLFVNKGADMIKPGAFSFIGTYTAEYD